MERKKKDVERSTQSASGKDAAEQQRERCRCVFFRTTQPYLVCEKVLDKIPDFDRAMNEVFGTLRDLYPTEKCFVKVYLESAAPKPGRKPETPKCLNTIYWIGPS